MRLFGLSWCQRDSKRGGRKERYLQEFFGCFRDKEDLQSA